MNPLKKIAFLKPDGSYDSIGNVILALIGGIWVGMVILTIYTLVK